MVSMGTREERVMGCFGQRTLYMRIKLKRGEWSLNSESEGRRGWSPVLSSTLFYFPNNQVGLQPLLANRGNQGGIMFFGSRVFDVVTLLWLS